MNSKESISEKMAIDEMVSSDASAGYSDAVAANILQPHLNSYRNIPPKENAEFVACMEDLLLTANRIKNRLEIHYTPKHGSWLDMAEIELNVMTIQCLKRRIDNLDKLRFELVA